MKVIKEGNNNPKETKKKCSKCKTVFTFTEQDIKPDWRDGDYVNCPTCGNFIAAR